MLYRYFYRKVRTPLKSNTAYCLTLLYLLAMLRPIGPLLEYVIYEDHIAEFLCINKENVTLDCNGKCYLMQRLVQQEEEKKQNLPKISLEEYPIGFVELFQLKNDPITDCGKATSIIYRKSYSYLYAYLNFHPPSHIG